MVSLVVVGASQGGVDAIHRLITALPEDFPVAILVVVHIGVGSSTLPSILSDLRKMPASHARNGEEILCGHVYIAPPDQHMLVAGGHLELSHGPRENWTRPAVDPLFRTAAEAFGPEVVGIILTGGLNDGTAGLHEIKRRGGIAIVQDPGEAEAPSMPRSALDNVAIDHCLPLSKMPELLMELTRIPNGAERPLRRGVRIMLPDEQPLQHPTAQTCPDCGGAMREEKIGTLAQYRCHIGHVMTAEVLAAAQVDVLEYNVAAVLRTLNERTELCSDLASQYRTRKNAIAEKQWAEAGEQAREREHSVRGMTETKWLRPERNATHSDKR